MADYLNYYSFNPTHNKNNVQFQTIAIPDQFVG